MEGEEPLGPPAAPESAIPAGVGVVLKNLLVNWVLPLIGLFVALIAFETLFAPKPSIDVGGAAPEFRLPETGGEVVALSDLRGKKVLLNFWGTWCPPCREELPTLTRFAREHPEVAVLGLAVDSGNLDTLRKAKEHYGIGFSVLRSDDVVQQAYGVKRLPTTFLLDEQGLVARYKVGKVSRRQLQGWLN